VAALLFRRHLVFEVDAGGARLDHGLHQLESVQGAAEAGLRVGHDGGEPVAGAIALGVLDLIGPLQRAVDAAHHLRHAVHRVEALVGIGLARGVGVGRHLPAGQVDGLEAGPHHRWPGCR
jgi:hypothetical protein